MLRLATAVWILSLGLAWARIGESPEGITERYGTSRGEFERINTNHVVRTYMSDGYKIVVSFVDNKSVSEIFTKTSEVDTRIQRSEILDLLEANSQGQEWQPKASGGLQQHWWQRADGRLGAIYITNDKPPKLWIFTTEYMEFAREAKSSRDRRKPKNF